MKFKYMIFGLMLLPIFSQVALASNVICTVGTSRCTNAFESVQYGDAVLPCNPNTGTWCDAGQSSAGCNIRTCSKGCYTDVNNVPHCGEDTTVCKQCTPDSKWCEGNIAYTCQWSILASCWIKGYDTSHAQLCQYGCTNGHCNEAPPISCQSECSNTLQTACRTGLDGIPSNTKTYCSQQPNGCYKYDINDNRDISCPYGCGGVDGQAYCNQAPIVCKTSCSVGETTSDGTYIYTCIADSSTNNTCNKWCDNPNDCINWYSEPSTGVKKSGIIKCDTDISFNRETGNFECDSFLSYGTGKKIVGYVTTNPITFLTNLKNIFPNETTIGQTESWVGGGFKYVVNSTEAHVFPTLSIGEINSQTGITDNIFVYILGNFMDNTTYGLFYDNKHLWVELNDNIWYSLNPYTLEYENTFFKGVVGNYGNPVYKENKLYFTSSGVYTSNYTYIMEYTALYDEYINSTPVRFILGDGKNSIRQLIYDGDKWWGVGKRCEITGGCFAYETDVFEFGENWSLINTYTNYSFSKGVILSDVTQDKSKFLGKDADIVNEVFLLTKNGQVISDSCPPSKNGLYAARCAGTNYISPVTGTPYPLVFTEKQYCTENTNTGQWQWNGDPELSISLGGMTSCTYGCEKQITIIPVGSQDYYYVPVQCKTTPPVFVCPNDCTKSGDKKCVNGYMVTCQDLSILTSGSACFGWMQNSTKCPSGKCAPNGKSCSLSDECRIGENFCVSLGNMDWIQNCFYDRNVGANRICQESSNRCNLSQCADNQICFQSFNQSSSLTTAECVSIGYKDLQSFGNWLSEFGIGFDKHSQIGIIASNDYGRGIFFIILSIALLVVGFYASGEIWGGVGLGSLGILGGVMAGWLPPVLIVIVIIGLGYALMKMIFGGSGE